MKHIGLVMSGGMGKGAYQIGALMALREYFNPSDFEYVSAASIGVLNTYVYLTDNLDRAKKIWKSVNLKGDKRFVTSVLRSQFLQDIISDIITERNIEPTFYVPLLNLSNKELNYYNISKIDSKYIKSYLQASIAMPFLNKGVEIEGKTLYDGAVVDNIPIYPVLLKELDYIFCIYFDDFNYVFEDYRLDERIIKLTFPDNTIVSNSVYITHDSIEYMIEAGYQKTRKVLSGLFFNGIDDTEEVYKRNRDRNSAMSRKIVRITGDVVVTNMNKITKKIIRHRRVFEL